MAAPAYSPVTSFAFDDPEPSLHSTQSHAQISTTSCADQVQNPTGKGLRALQVINKFDDLWFWKNVLGCSSHGQDIPSTHGSHGGSHAGIEGESVHLSFPRRDLDEEPLTPRFQTLNSEEKLADLGGDEKREREECDRAMEGDLEMSSFNHAAVGLEENRTLLIEAHEKKNEVHSGSSSLKKEDKHRFGPASKPPLQNSSGRQLLTEMRTGIPMSRRRRRMRRKRMKSQTELDKDEVKGFQDLGFSFREDQLTPSIVKLVPGLKPRNKESLNAANSSPEQPSTPRLYPSEDWWTRKTEPPIATWQMPDPHKKGIDMKEQLKFWAHIVAYNVRQEC